MRKVEDTRLRFQQKKPLHIGAENSMAVFTVDLPHAATLAVAQLTVNVKTLPTYFAITAAQLYELSMQSAPQSFVPDGQQPQQIDSMPLPWRQGE